MVKFLPTKIEDCSTSLEKRCFQTVVNFRSKGDFNSVDVARYLFHLEGGSPSLNRTIDRYYYKVGKKVIKALKKDYQLTDNSKDEFGKIMHELYVLNDDGFQHSKIILQLRDIILNKNQIDTKHPEDLAGETISFSDDLFIVGPYIRDFEIINKINTLNQEQKEIFYQYQKHLIKVSLGIAKGKNYEKTIFQNFPDESIDTSYLYLSNSIYTYLVQMALNYFKNSEQTNDFDKEYISDFLEHIKNQDKQIHELYSLILQTASKLEDLPAKLFDLIIKSGPSKENIDKLIHTIIKDEIINQVTNNDISM